MVIQRINIKNCYIKAKILPKYELLFCHKASSYEN